MLSFAPDRRSLQRTFYHFNDRDSGNFDRRGFSQVDTVAIALNKIYHEKFPQNFIDDNLITILVNTLVSDVPIGHHNLTLLAVAAYIIYFMRLRTGNQLTPEIFNGLVNDLPPRIMSDIIQGAESKKKAVDTQAARAEFKTTLLRYVIYVNSHIPYQAPTPQEVS